MSLLFRLAEAADQPTVTAIVRAAYAKWVPVIGREPLPMRADYGRAIAEHTIHLAVSGGRVAGLIETVLHPDHLWIENVAVSPQDQGAGIGRRLLALADDLARSQGRPEIRLLTNAAFASNVHLYERVGFATVRHEDFMGGVTVYMSKPVKLQL